jgi:hypothetical protein
MNVIGHHYRCAEVEFYFVIVQATFEDDPAGGLGKDPPMIRAEGDEVLAFVTLKMRELSPVKSCSHRPVWGQPVSAVRRGGTPLASL